MISDAAMMTLGALIVVFVALVIAALLHLRAWARETAEWAARCERRHQETMVDLAISSLRREEEHARRMQTLETPGQPSAP